jgi:hypothetical protein
MNNSGEQRRSGGPPVLDRPPAGIEVHEELEVTQDAWRLEGWDQFPDVLFAIELGAGRYASNNLNAGDMYFNALAVFETEEQAEIYWMMDQGPKGTPERMTFEEARRIATAKNNLQALALWRDGKVVDFHFVE